jgi:hypothetical protein
MRIVSERLASKLDHYRSSGLFNDVILVSNGESHACQRILLARHCRWFEREFVANPVPFGQPLTLTLPVNPDNILPRFLDLLYTGDCEITMDTLPPLLKMAIFYGAPALCDIFRYFVQLEIAELPLPKPDPSQLIEAMKRENDKRRRNLLPFAREFCRLELTDDGIALAPFIAKYVRKLFLPDEKEAPLFKLPDLYASVAPQVFAAILNDPQVRSDDLGLTDDRLVELIDSYVGSRELDDADDREALASVVSWTEPDSYRHLVNHRCEWLPAKYARPLLRKIFRHRVLTGDHMGRDVRRTGDLSSRWYLFSWLQAIREAKPVRSSPAVRLLDFVATLGGEAKRFNPQPFGFVKSIQSVAAVAPEFDAQALFRPDRYFMALPVEGVVPMIGLDFGRTTGIVVGGIIVDTDCPVRNPKGRHPPKPTHTALVLKLADTVDACFSAGEHWEAKVDLVAGKADFELTDMPKCSVLAVEFRELNSTGFDLARLYNLDFIGYFASS